MTPRDRSRLVVIGAAGAPLALVGALSLLGKTPGPTVAFASSDDPAPIFTHTVAPPTKQERAAADFAAARRDQPVGMAPFLYPEPAPIEAAAPSATPATPADPPPTLSVNTVMAGRNGAMATVNGKLRRVGDEIAPGWTITAIDAAAGSVTVRHADGREIVGRRAG